mmetsp:Transcript_1253/g.2718  ORF Transcript_1253/g.2718 Transcript_1253/m.2718 type:complete len:157 (+) Transcript_1253:152-622(+)
MKYTLIVATSMAVVGLSSAYSFTGSSLKSPSPSLASRRSRISMEYIPDGISKEKWAKMKAAEKAKNKNLGANGITKFKSRSFSEWQKAGGVNLFPVDPKKAKKASDVPYMQRPGGMPDDSDLLPKKKGGFSFGKKKAAPQKAAAPAPKKKKNWFGQ